MKKICYIILILLVNLAILFSIIACTQKRPYSPQENQTPEVRFQPQQGTEDDQSQERLSTGDPIVGVAHSIIPTVVGISTTEITRESMWSQPETIQGVGSGVVVHPDGYILTNDHVAGGDPSSISVIFRNGDELEGTTLWTDHTLDLAIVKVDAANLPAAHLGSSESLAVGERAIAVGTPLGLQFQHTVTSGIISALNRTVRVSTNLGENFMEDLIQTDASINPGNSGGPLVNIRGEVIGINTVKVSSAEGIGFAIPIDVAKPVIQHFVDEGSFITPYLGVVGFDREMASYYNKDHRVEEGVYVVELDRRAPAYLAGIRIDDIITMIGDQKINKMLDLRKAVYSYRVGQNMDIKVIRDGQEMIFNITLVEKPV